MAAKIRVLVIDDSLVIRKVVTGILADEPDMEVVGTAPEASLALLRLEQTKPDVITLDVEMPGKSGLDLLIEIRRRAPKLPVVMFSSLTKQAAATTLEALARGASDYVTKPSGENLAASVEQVRSQLVAKIRALGRQPRLSMEVPVLPPPAPSQRYAQGLGVLAIGCSTGGPNALGTLFEQLPRDFPVPIVIVQHMPPLFTRLLSERLTALGRVPVMEAVHGQQLESGKAYIAPGDFHMQVVQKGKQIQVATQREAPENSCRPAVDVLFRSVASVFGARALAVVMTGMGQDGLAGAQAIRGAGGQVIVQDQASSVVWGMPGHVARAGLAEAVLPLPELAGEIVRRALRTRAALTLLPTTGEHDVRL